MAFVLPLFIRGTTAMAGLPLVVGSLTAGVLFGFSMAFHMGSKAAHYDLPKWERIKDAG